MNVGVDIKILEQTVLCYKNFKCLTEGKKFLCKIENVDFNTIYFIKINRLSHNCPYKKEFDKKPCCTCLTRIEIYKESGY